MSLHRTFFRRKGCIFLILLATTCWICYLIISVPAAKDQRFPSVDVIYDSGFRRSKGESVTRRYVTAAPSQKPPLQPQLHPKDIVIQAPDVVKDVKSQDNPDQSIQEAHGPKKDEERGDSNGMKEGNSAPRKDNSAAKQAKTMIKEDKSAAKQDNSGAKKDNPHETNIIEEIQDNPSVLEKVANKSLINQTKPENRTKGPVIKDVGQQVREMGEKIKNKTIEVGANIRNKTIEKLADLGVIQKKSVIKLIYKKVRWNLNVSMADIAYIMKDTEFLKKKQNLTDMEYQPLSPNNSTSIVDFNFTKPKYGLGYCDCKDLTCLCCVRIQNKWLKINSSACSQLNFVSKSQELQFEFRMDDKPIHKDTIAAEFPPKICLESDSAAAGACVLFSNVTSHVNIAAENHKIHLSGCMEIALTLFNKTLSDFPVSCFKIPGPGNEKEHENNANFGNFVP